MIELLLQGERALDLGLLDQAEQVYWQAIERDPQNAIAVVGLARVAIERGDEATGYRFALKALEIDPENATARRLAGRMAEVIEYRGDSLPQAPAEIPSSDAIATSATMDDPPPVGEPAGPGREAAGPGSEAAQGAGLTSEPAEPGSEAAERAGLRSEPAEPTGEAAEPSRRASEPAEPADAAEPGASADTPPDPSAGDPAQPASSAPAPPFGASAPQPPLVVPTRRRGLIRRLLRGR